MVELVEGTRIVKINDEFAKSDFRRPVSAFYFYEGANFVFVIYFAFP